MQIAISVYLVNNICRFSSLTEGPFSAYKHAPTIPKVFFLGRGGENLAKAEVTPKISQLNTTDVCVCVLRTGFDVNHKSVTFYVHT